MNRSTGYTPNMLMLGREVTQPVDLMFPLPRPDAPIDADNYLAELQRNIVIAHEIARDTLKTTQKFMKRDYDLKILENSYEVGDVVYVLDTATVKGKCRKLSPSWKGPGVITKKHSAYVYDVKLRGKTSSMNHDRIKKCKDRQLPEWIRKHQSNSATNAVADANQFCICRGPDTGSFMIQCDECREWFHGSCVKVTQAYAAKLAFFLCPECDC